MRIHLRYYGIVGDLIRPKVDVLELDDGATVGDAMDTLSGQSDEVAAVLRQVSVFVNDKQVDRSTVLQSDATVTLMRPIAGGTNRAPSASVYSS